MMKVIYKIISPINKIYIGQSSNIKNRLYQYESCNVPNQKHLYRSIKKYGWDSHIFEVVYELPNDVSQQVLNEHEKFFWIQFKEAGFVMLNIKEPGSNGKHSEETKLKIGKSNSVSLLGKKQSKELIAKTAKRMIGNKYRLGCKISEEHKNKIAEANRGKVLSKETKNKISDSRLGSKNHMFGKVYSKEERLAISIAVKAAKLKIKNNVQKSPQDYI
jgi:group I intron endonuclease